MTKAEIAEVCHEANRAYSKALGDYYHRVWDDAPEWQKQSAIEGVESLIESGATPKEMHERWSKFKRDNGWIFGPYKNYEQKTHPCLVAYENLPRHERRKDDLFIAIVNTLKSVL